ncbi:MAG: LPS assembly protein LptD [Holosporaceae bacterium]|jgi:LPS-assembly protein|nr:LPS assembly protein LptD [Holosporaceae bacterium]
MELRRCLLLISTAHFFAFPEVCGDDVTFINSNRTSYTEEAVHCVGNVIIICYGHIIAADEISYDKKKEIIEAKGKVIVRDERSNTYYADFISVGKDFKSGCAKNVKIVMPNKTRLAAAVCTIKDRKFLLKNVIYTPCYRCSESGELTWQVKSRRVTFDPKDYTEYEEANFELFGTPVIHAPYLYHVSPQVKRKSGMLVPKFSTSSDSGFSMLPQYFHSISDSQELIVKPIFTSKIGSVAWTYYGLRFPHGEFNVDASITGAKSISHQVGKDVPEQKAIKKMQSSGYRGHVFSKLRYEIDRHWRCRSDINLTSDRHYLKRFPFLPGEDRILESNAWLEGFHGRSYTSVKAAMFQSDHLENAPRLLPSIERNYCCDLFSGAFGWDSAFTNLDFNNHRSAQKVVSNVSWCKKFLLPHGNICHLSSTLSFKGLKISEREKSDYNSAFGVIPQIHGSWRWPLICYLNQHRTILTPIVGVIISGNRKIGDVFEDQFCEIDEMNIFDENRSISLYNLDTGKRIYYGAKLSGYRNGENLYHFTVGRSFEFTAPPERLETSGIKHKHSNVIAALETTLTEGLSFNCSGSYSTVSKRWLKIESGLRYLDAKFEAEVMIFRGRQAEHNPFAANFNDENRKIQKYKGASLDVGWRATAFTTLKAGVVIGNEFKNALYVDGAPVDRHKLVSHYVGVGYKDECTEVNLAVERHNYNDGDLKPGASFTMVVHLKNLGI